MAKLQAEMKLFSPEQAEEQIKEYIKIIDYNTFDYPVEVMVERYSEGLEEGTNEFFVPDYQRDFVWSNERQSRFIESVLIGLPIPTIFLADIHDDNEYEGRLEIVDGSQRIRTLKAYLADELRLTKMEKLTHLEGTVFSDLTSGRQKRFRRFNLRVVVLSEKADEEARRDLFDRINTGSDKLTDMEQRFGSKTGKALELLKRCAANKKFPTLAPLPKGAVRRNEREEFVLRFFAYLHNYADFEKRVKEFLNEYLDSINNDDLDVDKHYAEFERMLNFVEQHFPNGFKKSATNNRTPRIRFEAIAVGTALALQKKSDLEPSDIGEWLYSGEFKKLTTSDASNSRPKVIKRIEFVRDKLLGEHP